MLLIPMPKAVRSITRSPIITRNNRQYPDADAAYANVVLTQSLIPLAKQAHPDVSTIHQQTFWQTLFRGALGGWLTALLLITILACE